MVRYLNGDYQVNSVDQLQKLETLTLFVPTDEAIDRIPIQKLNELQSEQPRLQAVSLSVISNIHTLH